MVVGGKTVHLLQDIKAHLEDKILNGSKIHELGQREKAQPKNVKPKES